jgi:hypothetical protein
MEETRENHWPVTDELYHIMLYTSPWSRIELTTSVMIYTDCIGSCKSNYHVITSMTAHILHGNALQNIKRKNALVLLQYSKSVWSKVGSGKSCQMYAIFTMFSSSEVPFLHFLILIALCICWECLAVTINIMTFCGLFIAAIL